MKYRASFLTPLLIASMLAAATPAQAMIVPPVSPPSPVEGAKDWAIALGMACAFAVYIPFDIARGAVRGVARRIQVCSGSRDAERTEEEAIRYCAEAGLRLPTVVELAVAFNPNGLTSDNSEAPALKLFTEEGKLYELRYDASTFDPSSLDSIPANQSRFWTSTKLSKYRLDDTGSTALFVRKDGTFEGKANIPYHRERAHTICVKAIE